MPKEGAMERIEKELTGEPIQVGATTVRPVARLHGRRSAARRSSDGPAWGFARLEPVALIVDGPDGAVRRIAIADPDVRGAWALLRVGLLVAAVSAAAIAARRLAR